ncbi:hypothetical protein HDU79_002231 [Rhizoclosmatium sp. JEL0117]|nr:hypothetical protein HDU79_002231 [Rhizoclosmatium sp. JEL0117]
MQFRHRRLQAALALVLCTIAMYFLFFSGPSKSSLLETQATRPTAKTKANAKDPNSNSNAKHHPAERPIPVAALPNQNGLAVPPPPKKDLKLKNVNVNVVNQANNPNQDASKGYLPPRKNIPFEDLEKDIDLLQARFLDFLNGEEGETDESTPYGVFGGSLLDLDGPFSIRTTWNHIHQYAQHLTAKPYPRGDINALARRSRALLIAYTIIYDQPSLTTLLALATSPKNQSAQSARNQLTAELSQIVESLTNQLYPWLKPRYNSLQDMQKYFSNSKTRDLGIVFTTGQWHFELALHAILTLRDVLKCTLPIQVLYMGPNDLPAEMLAAFRAIPGVSTLDITTKFAAADIGGWAVKPFSILASEFRTSIFIDADVLFFQNPETMVKESMLFKEYGQLFYHDRSIGRDDPVEWFRSIDPEMTQYATRLRYTNGLSSHEMESGVVVVDKARTGNLHALLMVCQMNSKEERETVYKHMHGDKETFWMSWDMIRVPYKFTPTFGGTVGYMNEKSHVCGGLFHTDEYQRPLWWNGSVLKNKHHHKDSGYMEFEYAAFDTDADKIEWEWETENSPFCFGPRYPEREIVVLSDLNKANGKKYVDMYVEIKEKGWKQYVEGRFKVKV